MKIFCHSNFNLYLLSPEAFENLKRNYQGEIKEMENTANRLKMQLKLAQAELKQARTALKTMEASDGNGNYRLNFQKITYFCLVNKRIFVRIAVIILVVH